MVVPSDLTVTVGNLKVNGHVDLGWRSWRTKFGDPDSPCFDPFGLALGHVSWVALACRGPRRVSLVTMS